MKAQRHNYSYNVMAKTLQKDKNGIRVKYLLLCLLIPNEHTD